MKSIKLHVVKLAVTENKKTNKRSISMRIATRNNPTRMDKLFSHLLQEILPKARLI